MNSNIIRNYNEIINDKIIPGIKYVQKIFQITKEEDKESCLRFLTNNHKNKLLCQQIYDDTFINTVIEDSEYCIFFHKQNDPENIVTFALVKLRSKKKGKILDISLVCAVPNKNNFGRMIAYSLFHFALKKNCKFLYTSPRTSELRKTFIKYGFEPIHGIEGINEVLEKEIEDNSITITKRGKTLKVKRKITNTNDIVGNSNFEQMYAADF
jgi:hypothetical protein